ncbi:helix-turn-helix domain-containing protein [Synechococcus sp. MIT S1220]|uniref:helix-turn-helix domain-containing protein n=1 Tax=Synechococcus sp. MIT S1220 TaxID=3082549 RepID=UPI0039B04B90
MAAKDKQLKSQQSVETDDGLVHVGQQIRDARESHGLSAEALASSLHMGVEQLRALEAARRDQLPEPVFVRAMVRRLASHLRLDADSLVEQLGTTQQHLPAAQFKAISPPHQPLRNKRPNKSRPSSKRWVLPVLILSGGAGLLIWQIQAGHDLQLVQEPAPTTTAIESEPTPSASAPTESTPTASAPTETTSIPVQESTVQISSVEPSWIALRREGTIEFQGTLDQPITIDEPASVEILAGRPDLVMVNISDEQPRSIGAIHEVGWRQLIPEQ